MRFLISGVQIHIGKESGLGESGYILQSETRLNILLKLANKRLKFVEHFISFEGKRDPTQKQIQAQQKQHSSYF